MAWTAPRTWVVAEVVTAAIMNTHLRDQLRYLKGLDGVPTIQNGLIVDNSLGTEYLTVPSLTTTQRDALTPVNGMVIYNSTLTVFQRYEAAAWVSFTNLAAMTIASIAQGDTFFRGASVIERLAIGSAGQVYQVSGGVPAWGASSLVIALGSYTGDDTANRAIAHGLGITPKLVVIVCNSNPEIILQIQGYDSCISTGAYGTQAVTAMSATNFYVHNATSYGANVLNRTYKWVALA